MLARSLRRRGLAVLREHLKDTPLNDFRIGLSEHLAGHTDDTVSTLLRKEFKINQQLGPLSLGTRFLCYLCKMAKDWIDLVAIQEGLSTISFL